MICIRIARTENILPCTRVILLYQNIDDDVHQLATRMINATAIYKVYQVYPMDTCYW